MNTNRNHHLRPEQNQRMFQDLRERWQAWLGQLAFILLALCALLKWRQWAAIFIAILLMGMFHQRVLAIVTECFACLNDLFLGNAVNGDVNAREGGLVQGVANVANRLWGWVRKPFQPREPKDIPPVTGEGRKAAVLRRLAGSIDGEKDGLKRQKAESLRHRADLAAEKYQKKQEKLRQKAMEDSTKSMLSWTHLIGAVILTALTVIFIAGELVITLQTLLGMMDVQLPKVLDENPIFKSFEIMTAAVLVSAGILFGIYILDLLGFLPLIPVHLLSITVQRIMLGLMTCCCVGTVVVVGALAGYRCVSLQGGMDADMMAEPMAGDVIDRFEMVPAGVTPASPEPHSTLTTTDAEVKLISISLIGISLLGAIGAILAFNGPVTLLLFLTVGIMALITGVTAVFGLFTRLLRWIIMILYSLLHMLLNALLAMAAMVARPFVRVFSIHGTDINNDGEDNTETFPQQGENLPPHQPPRIVETSQQNADGGSDSDQMSESPRIVETPTQDEPQTEAEQTPQEERTSFEPSNAEWNPLA